MVDRGGLNYPIRVKDEFSATTQRFRKELRASKAEFRSFQKELRSGRASAKNIRDTAKATRELATAQRQLAQASNRTTKPLSDEEKALRRLAEAQRQQIAREKEAIRIRNSQRADLRAEIARRERSARAEERAARQREIAERRARRIQERGDPRIQAERKVTQELFRQKVLVEQISLLRARAATQRAGGDIIGGDATLRRAKELETRLKGSAKQANNIFFTFRRLVGTLAIFTLARRGVQAFNDLVAAGLKFNDTIETSTLGIAGLVATLGDVRNELGQSVSAAEELDLALGLSRKQIELLRQDSLRTVATFSQLLDTFQVAVGPGLAAGLNLDEVRQLTVQISQAAAALSVPQNQLAEEIRSLLAGTIQARTTRIATALGITNADIRRLRESGELFDFLDERLEGFAASAQRAARETLTGLRSLLQGAFEALVGEAAEPLFKELLQLGNELLDEVLTIEDAFGNLQPNPQVVASFRELFDALAEGVRAARDFGQNLDFEGLRTTLGGVGFVFQVIVGAVRSITTLFAELLSLITIFREELGLTTGESNNFAQSIGRWGARIAVALGVLKLFNLELLKTVRGPAILVAAFAAVAEAITLILEKIFDVDLTIRDTISLITLGLFGAWIKIVEVVQTLAETTISSLKGALDTVVSKVKSSALRALGFIQSELLFDDVGAQAFKDRAFEEEAALRKRDAARKASLKVELDAIKAEAKARQEAVDEEIAGIVGAAAERAARGPGFDPNFDAEKAAREAAEAAAGAIVSTADKPILALSESLLKLTDNLRRARTELGQGGGARGFGGQLGDQLDQEAIESSERLLGVQAEIEQVQENIRALRETGLVTDERIFAINDALRQSVEDRDAALEALELTKEEGLLVSLLREQRLLREALSDAEKTSFELAVAKAAVIAQQELPALREQVNLLNTQAAAQAAVTAAELAGASQRQLRLVNSRNELAVQREQLTALIQRNMQELASAQRAADAAAEGTKEKEVLDAAVESLTERQRIEQEILGLKVAQTAEELKQAELIENGNALQGARQGLEELAGELPTIFEVGLNLTKTFVTGFANFAATEIVNAIVNAQQEGVDESELFKQAAGRFAQELATQILQQVINNLIGLLLQATVGRAAAEATSATTAAGIRVAGAFEAGAIEVAAATQAAAIRAASGGFGGHEGGFVQGFNAGGPVSGSSSARPRGLHPADTVPAWLAPGEFVMRRAAVQALGLNTLNAMNGGNMTVTGSASAEAAGPSVGMQSGGLVSDRTPQPAPGSGSDEPNTVVVPAVVANDRELDQLTAGGRNAMLSFMRENAGDINTLLDRGAGRG